LADIPRQTHKSTGARHDTHPHFFPQPNFEYKFEASVCVSSIKSFIV
jgi:hypothetical protein